MVQDFSFPMKTKLASAIVAALLGGSVAANAAIIDFSADAAGSKANGYSPVGHPLVTFTDTLGADLTVNNFGGQSIGQGLAVFGDDASKLQINFGSAMSYLSLVFGNDDANYTLATDKAWLELFDGATSVGVFSVLLNRNDLADQTIIGTAATFNRALFWYGDAAGGPTTGPNPNSGLIEIVDNIEYRAAGVPDVGNTAGLAALAMLGLVAMRRRMVA